MPCSTAASLHTEHRAGRELLPACFWVVCCIDKCTAIPHNNRKWKKAGDLMLKRLYEKNELYFALTWIGAYVLVMNLAMQVCGGFDNLA